MPNTQKLDQILEHLSRMETEFKDSFSKIEGRLTHLERDMKKMLKCVDHENADFDPLDGVLKKDTAQKKTIGKI